MAVAVQRERFAKRTLDRLALRPPPKYWSILSMWASFQDSRTQRNFRQLRALIVPPGNLTSERPRCVLIPILVVYLQEFHGCHRRALCKDALQYTHLRKASPHMSCEDKVSSRPGKTTNCS